MASTETPSLQVIDPGNKPLAGRTVLIGQRNDLATPLQSAGARVMPWPQVQICAPQSFDALDEAIDHLFGYDWLIFRNIHAVEFFRQRMNHLGHHPDELDSLRILAMNNATSEQLSSSQIHVDVVVSRHTDQDAARELESYLGGRAAIGQTNFLNLRAANSAETLSSRLEEMGARVDTVIAYRTVRVDNSVLAQQKVLLKGGGVDCIAFQEPGDIEQLAELFDTGDLHSLLSGVMIACTDDALAADAALFGVNPHIISDEKGADSLTKTIVLYFSQRAGNL